MPTTCLDPVLHNLGLIKDHVLGGKNKFNWFNTGFLLNAPDNFRALEPKLQCLRIFLVWATKWRSKNDLYLESSNEEEDNKQKVITLHSFLSNIEDAVNKYGAQIQSLSLRKETEVVHLAQLVLDLNPVISDFHASIKSFNQEIVVAFIALLRCTSSDQSSSGMMRGDELVYLIGLLVQNLKEIVHLRFFCTREEHYISLQAQVEALVDKLTFLKDFVRFAQLHGAENYQLGDLLLHTEVVALSAARISYMCSWYHEDVKPQSPEIGSLISELIRMIKPVHSRISEIYISVLRAASRVSALTHVTEMDKQIIGNFNDSLISCLWELLWSNYTSFPDPVKDQMKLLYEGLRFLRSILREPQKMDMLNEDIRAVIAEAGVIIFSLSRHQEKNGDVDSLELKLVLVDTNRDIKIIEAQNINSGAPGSLPSDNYIKQKVESKKVESKISSLTQSKAKTSRIHEAIVVLHDQIERVEDRLVSGSNQLEIVPIVGMPGLGKTTLAKTIFGNPSIMYHFHVCLWCCVSQSYNKKNVLLQILGVDDKSSSTNSWPKEMDENDLLLKLYQKLKRNKYLIVFDDVWDIAVWNDLRMSFPNDENGSRILITSRFSNLASQIGEPHNLRSLTSAEAWDLLQKKMFGKEDCPEALQRLGMEIAKKCKGLPLTVVIIAGILTTIEHDAWEEVAKNLTSTIVYGMDQHCKNALELSYMHLPSYLQHCLLYFGAFREDQEIPIRNLTWLWVAEGFVQPTESKRLEDVAEEYLMDLVGRNLIMVTKQRSIGGAKTCCIHDLIHEFCKAKAKEENFLQVLHGYDELFVFIEPPNLLRLSICSGQEEFCKSRLFCPNARSLLFFNHIEEYSTKTTDISFIFYIYKHLRVLNIEQILLWDKIILSETRLLVQLRYFAARVTWRNSVPLALANLPNLETFLLICDSYGYISLTDTIWNLKKLVHLHITGGHVTCLLPTENPENTSSLDNLDTFSSLHVSLEHLEDIVKKIPNVRQLGINLTGYPSTYCNTTPTMVSLSRLERLESLEVSLSSALSKQKCHIE